MGTEPAILILDTTVLINFLTIDRAVDFAHLSGQVLVTENVVAEITAHFPEQQERLRAALEASWISQIQITDLAELEDFAKLTSRKTAKRKRLGDGECSAIVVALHRNYVLAMDDKAAIKQTRELYPQIPICQTFELVLQLIKSGRITVEAADAIKADWAANHKFTLTGFTSFGELL